MRNQRVLVTGGAGFIGSELVRQLAANGNHVTVVDNLVNGKRDNLAGIDGRFCTLSPADIRDLATMQTLLQGQDAVFHLACLGVRHSLHAPLENHEVNATATLNLLRLSREAGVKRFLHCSSSEVYGTARWVPMTEDHPTFPMTVYGASKLAGECYARAFFETCGFPVTVVRPFNSYGPRSHHEGDSGEVIPKFMLRTLCDKPMIIFGDGTQTRDFTCVTDTAAGIIRAADSEVAIGATLNLGSCREISILELAETVKEITGRPEAAIVHDTPRPGDVLRLFADSSLAENLIGFRPEVTLKTGLSRLLEWYRSSGVSPETMLAQEKERNWEK